MLKTVQHCTRLYKMALFEIRPFHHPAVRRTCRRGMWGSSCRNGLWPSMWNGYPGTMELALPVASDLLSRSKNAAFLNAKLNQEVTEEEDSITFPLPLGGFDMKDLEVKVEDSGALKVSQRLTKKMRF